MLNPNDEPLGRNRLDLKCPCCQRFFKSKPVLRRHLKSVHVEPQPCRFCGKYLKISGRMDLLRSHLEHCVEFRQYLGNCTMDYVVQQAQIYARRISRENNM